MAGAGAATFAATTLRFADRPRWRHPRGLRRPGVLGWRAPAWGAGVGHRRRLLRLGRVARRVDGLYIRVLGRVPDPAGRQFWIGELLRLDDVALAADLASSDEFFARAQAA